MNIVRTASLSDDDKLVESLPTFVSLDRKLTCQLCDRVLQNPVQTECGHRFCEKCVKIYINESQDKSLGRPVICPAKEETCDEEISEEFVSVFVIFNRNLHTCTS